MGVIQVVILIVTMVLWTVIGLIFWVPILFRSTASLTGGILYCTITQTDPDYLKASFQNAVSFYARGFEAIRFVFSDKTNASPKSSPGDTHDGKWWRTIIEMVWAAIFWGATYIAIFGMPGNPLLAFRAEYSAEGYYERGRALNSQQKYDLASEDLTKAITLKPELTDAYFSRGLAYHNQRQYEAAISDLTHFITLQPNSAYAYWFRGSCYKNLGRVKEAVVDYQKTLSLELTDVDRTEVQQQLRALTQH